MSLRCNVFILCLLLASPALAQATPDTPAQGVSAQFLAEVMRFDGPGVIKLGRIVRNDTEGTMTLYMMGKTVILPPPPGDPQAIVIGPHPINPASIYILANKQKYYPLPDNSGSIAGGCKTLCNNGFSMRFPLIPFTPDSGFEIIYLEPTTISASQIASRTITAVRPPDMPPMRPGLWEETTTREEEWARMAKQPATTNTQTFCRTAAELADQMDGIPSENETGPERCPNSKASRSGNVFTMECSGRHSTTTVISDSEFTMDSEVTDVVPDAGKRTTRTHTVGKRLGDCPAK